MVQEVSTPLGDGYYAYEDNRWWWINDHDGPGGGGKLPAYGAGRRHFMVDTGFDPSLIGLDQNYAGFKQRATELYKVTFLPNPARVPAAGPVAVPGPAGGGLVVAPPANNNGTGAILEGSIDDVIDLVSQVIPALASPPSPPEIVDDDAPTNIVNVNKYITSLAQHGKRDEQIRALGTAVRLVMQQQGITRLNVREIVSVAAEGFAAFATLPKEPETTGDLTTDLRNTVKYLAGLAEHGKRDELIRVASKGLRLALDRRKLAA